MSTPAAQNGSMKYSAVISGGAHEAEFVAFFGRARLVRWPNGTFKIQGGSEEDRKNAAEWAARFLEVRFANHDGVKR